MPSGDEAIEPASPFRRRAAPPPLPVAAWHAGRRKHRGDAKGDAVLVHGQLVRRFYRAERGSEPHRGGGDRIVKKLEQPPPDGGPRRGAPADHLGAGQAADREHEVSREGGKRRAGREVQPAGAHRCRRRPTTQRLRGTTGGTGG